MICNSYYSLFDKSVLSKKWFLYFTFTSTYFLPPFPSYLFNILFPQHCITDIIPLTSFKWCVKRSSFNFGCSIPTCILKFLIPFDSKFLFISWPSNSIQIIIAKVPDSHYHWQRLDLINLMSWQQTCGGSKSLSSTVARSHLNATPAWPTQSPRALPPSVHQNIWGPTTYWMDSHASRAILQALDPNSRTARNQRNYLLRQSNSIVLAICHYHLDRMQSSTTW